MDLDCSYTMDSWEVSYNYFGQPPQVRILFKPQTPQVSLLRLGFLGYFLLWPEDTLRIYSVDLDCGSTVDSDLNLWGFGWISIDSNISS